MLTKVDTKETKILNDLCQATGEGISVIGQIVINLMLLHEKKKILKREEGLWKGYFILSSRGQKWEVKLEKLC